jgi:hypothetical protein
MTESNKKKQKIEMMGPNPKKQKRNEIIECNICYEEKDLIGCFFGCSLSSCENCILKIVDIGDEDITHKCPQCRRVANYKPRSVSSRQPCDVKFSNTILHNPMIVDGLLENWMNSNRVESDSLEDINIIPFFNFNDTFHNITYGYMSDTPNNVMSELMSLPELLARDELSGIVSQQEEENS